MNGIKVRSSLLIGNRDCNVRIPVRRAACGHGIKFWVVSLESA